MEAELKQRFLELWHKYFLDAELPIGLYYTDEAGRADRAQPEGRQCIICKLAQVRSGTSFSFDVDAVGCAGGRRYLGFVPSLRPQRRAWPRAPTPQDASSGQTTCRAAWCHKP